MELIDFVTASTAGVGAVLGVLNTMWAIRRDKVQVKVAAVWRGGLKRVGNSTKLGFITSDFAHSLNQLPDGRVGIRVTNVGLLDVTVDGVGFTSTGAIKRRWLNRLQRRVLLADPTMQTDLPRRLAPRESVTIWSMQSMPELRGTIHGVKRVYATTACGLNFFGTSGLLRALVRRAGS